MNDDELRDRLRAMPEPSASIDVDAVVADARRRRRPKVVGVAVASVAGCLALLAPVVVPGLLGPDPVTATLQDSGAAEQAPAAPAPEPTDEYAAGDPSVAGGGEEEAATSPGFPDLDSLPVGTCPTVLPVGDELEGVSIAFLEGPTDGRAVVTVDNDSSSTLVATVEDVALAIVGEDGTVLATSAQASTPVGYGTQLRIEPGESQSTSIVPVNLGLLACSEDEVAGDLVPVVTLSIDGRPGEVALIGDVWDP